MVEALRASKLRVALGGRTILSDLSIEVPKGTLFGILGPNGAGKTTLLKALAGLIPFQGSITHNGKSLGDLDGKARARTVAYVPQRSLLNAPLTVASVVAQGRYCHGSDLSALSNNDRSVIDNALSALDITTFRDRVFTELSGGEQRRVLLARALATEAPLILLDEPVSSLDIAHSLHVFHHMQQLAATGRTLIVVLHDLDDAVTWCDSLLLLAQGCVVAQGDPASVVTAERIREIYGVKVSAKPGLRYELGSTP